VTRRRGGGDAADAGASAELGRVGFDFAGEALACLSTFAGTSSRVRYFDASMQPHQRMLEKALPDRAAATCVMNRGEDLIAALTRGHDMPLSPPRLHASEIEMPLLIVHGDRGSSLDVEQAVRLELMLGKLGNVPRWMGSWEATATACRKRRLRLTASTRSCTTTPAARRPVGIENESQSNRAATRAEARR